MIGYRIKESVFISLFEKFNKVKHTCSFRECLEYSVGIPCEPIKQYFINNRIPFDDSFEWNIEERDRIALEVLTESLQQLK